MKPGKNTQSSGLTLSANFVGSLAETKFSYQRKSGMGGSKDSHPRDSPNFAVPQT
jgi:hypothetical protein